jgi:hypothetical protein
MAERDSQIKLGSANTGAADANKEELYHNEEGSYLTNESVGHLLRRAARLIEIEAQVKGADPEGDRSMERARQRARAYRAAAQSIETYNKPAWTLLEGGGIEALRTIQGVGPNISRSVATIYMKDGEWPYLEKLERRLPPPVVFGSIASIGPELGERIHEELGIDTLEELGKAAHDGRLAGIEGFGPGRLQAIREALAARTLDRMSGRHDPSIEELLDIDRWYRFIAEGHLPADFFDESNLAEKVEHRRPLSTPAGTLRVVSPNENNPNDVAWLPVLETTRYGRSYTALFSNSTRAHELGKTDDWVIIILDEDPLAPSEDDERRSWTIVTETSGPLQGRRVVRGREDECHALYI